MLGRAVNLARRFCLREQDDEFVPVRYYSDIRCIDVTLVAP